MAAGRAPCAVIGAMRSVDRDRYIASSRTTIRVPSIRTTACQAITECRSWERIPRWESHALGPAPQTPPGAGPTASGTNATGYRGCQAGTLSDAGELVS